jgi:hypothetical protein
MWQSSDIWERQKLTKTVSMKLDLFTLRKKCVWGGSDSLFENKVLRIMLSLMIAEVTGGGWRKLHNEENYRFTL